MCGVCGIARLSDAGNRADQVRQVQEMIEGLVHRGPDDVGLYDSGRAVLGATRLAIRGLTSGKQPLEDAAHEIVVVCNGEIDNSAELRAWLISRGREVPLATDIGVLPGLYLELGEEFVERLIGAFAIAVWDSRARRLLLARDRAGERPLFYFVQENEVRFATEIASLTAGRGHASVGPFTPDRDALARYLRFGSFAAPDTPFCEVRKVAPAEVVVFEAGKTRRRRYWRWGIVQTKKQEPSLDAFDRIFRQAVLRQSDVEVPYGVFLSGGIDSSLVSAVLRSVRPQHRPKAYTLRFDEQSYDEGIFAGQVARLLDLESVPVWVTPEAFPPGLAELIRIVGEPLADPAWVPTALLARRAAQDGKLALVGEGADELFGGYPTYLGVQASAIYADWPRPVKAVIKRLVQLWPPSEKKVTLSYLLKRFVAGAEMDGVTRHLLWTSNIAPDLLRRLVGGVESLPRGAAGDGEAGAGEGSDPGAASPPVLDLVQRIDLETSLAEGLLTKADRASMQSALELRAPFLDCQVMDFAATLPVEDRVHGLTTKVFLKRYATRYLPRAVVYRRKRGLSVPLSRWLRGPLREWAESRVSDERLRRAGVDPRAALGVLEEHCLRRADHARALWTIIVLDEWLRWAESRGE